MPAAPSLSRIFLARSRIDSSALAPGFSAPPGLLALPALPEPALARRRIERLRDLAQRGADPVGARRLLGALGAEPGELLERALAVPPPRRAGGLAGHVGERRPALPALVVTLVASARGRLVGLVGRSVLRMRGELGGLLEIGGGVRLDRRRRRHQRQHEAAIVAPHRQRQSRAEREAGNAAPRRTQRRQREALLHAQRRGGDGSPLPRDLLQRRVAPVASEGEAAGHDLAEPERVVDGAGSADLRGPAAAAQGDQRGGGSGGAGHEEAHRAGEGRPAGSVVREGEHERAARGDRAPGPEHPPCVLQQVVAPRNPRQARSRALHRVRRLLIAARRSVVRHRAALVGAAPWQCVCRLTESPARRLDVRDPQETRVVAWDQGCSARGAGPSRRGPAPTSRRHVATSLGREAAVGPAGTGVGADGERASARRRGNRATGPFELRTLTSVALAARGPQSAGVETVARLTFGHPRVRGDDVGAARVRALSPTASTRE